MATAYFGLASHAHALTVSPARLEIGGEPGTTIGGEIILYNEQDEQKTFYLSSENFEAQGESGAPNFVAATEGLATWINANPTVTLEAGGTETIPFTITIPSDARPGGHFAAIFWGTSPPNDNGQVTVGARVGVLLLLRVAGDITEKGGINEFNTLNSDKFYTNKQMTFVYRFQNAGDDRLLPEGTLKIKNIFGATVQQLNANESLGNILPGSTRKFQVNWNGGTPDSTNAKFSFKNELQNEWKHFGFGWYKATLDVTYGTAGTREVASTSFFVFSWMIVVIIVLALIIVIGGGRLALRKYNKFIIKQAQRYAYQIQKQKTTDTPDTDL